MKLLRSWSVATDSLTAYFDPSTRTVYDIHDTSGKFDVRAFGVSNGEISLLQSLSADFGTREEALTELDRIAALIEGKDEPRWGIGIDLASGPDSAVDVVIDRVTGKIVSVKDAITPAQGWVKGPPPQDGAWYLVTYTDTVDGSPQPGTAQWDDDAFYDDGGAAYGSAIITHHQPAPIVLP